MKFFVRVALLLSGAALLIALIVPRADAVISHSAPTPQSVSQSEAIRQLSVVRNSIDHTLALIKDGHVTEALTEARTGYLNHFEFVEIPLRIADPRLTSEAETKFAEIRTDISAGASVDHIRNNIVALRKLIDDAERRLTALGVAAPAVVFGQSFLIIFREGLEAVLLISILLGYLEAAKARQYRKPILIGAGAAALGTLATFVLLRTVLAAIPVGREMLEAITALIAVAVLFYVSFWLVARLEQKRWLEFLRARIWKAMSAGSTVALILIGFTAIYREGFETALFYQALLSFGPGLGEWIVAGLASGVVALSVAAWLILRLGRKLPIKALLSTAVILLMLTSVTLLGNAIRALQEADVIGLHHWDWPQAPIFLSQSLGYWPSRETLIAQGLLTAVYVAGGVYMFVIRPRRTAPKPVVTAAA